MSIKDVKVADLVSTKMAAEIIGCTSSWVQRMIREEKIEGVIRLGPRQIFLPRSTAEKIRDNPSSVGRPRSNTAPQGAKRPRASKPQ